MAHKIVVRWIGTTAEVTFEDKQGFVAVELLDQSEREYLLDKLQSPNGLDTRYPTPSEAKARGMYDFTAMPEFDETLIMGMLAAISLAPCPPPRVMDKDTTFEEFLEWMDISCKPESAIRASEPRRPAYPKGD